jgi:aminoglycoside 3-N-acetyltransferase
VGDENAAVARSDDVVTADSLARELRALGVTDGSVLLVHSSLSKLGWVAGGAHAVVDALCQVVGAAGTLVMPAHSGHLSEPSLWKLPPVPQAWWPVIRAETPAFDPHLTPTREMGAVVECFRHVPGVVRSAHPRHSFVAVGPLAGAIVADHRLGASLGEHSPLARCYERDALVLLLGVGHGNNTSLHLAEARADFAKQRLRNGSPMLVDGTRQWVEYEEDEINDRDFEALGAAFAATGKERTGPAGAGTARLMSQRGVVDFAVAWMNDNRH